ncbi:MAG: hypothetical protein RID09_13105 [Coleofasciculus sp. G1-WW12-02]|uniref:hypothetical protein n=1 Tax=Coleofasciculus sp. G1-WW12-02 TaxID=3068483 RepID=UPI0032FE7899
MDKSLDPLLQEQLTLRTDVQISRQMDDIIINVKTIAKNFSIASEDPKSPFKNVLAAATESNASIESIKNYIRYQVGRSGASRIWKVSKDKNLFATAVVEQIDSLKQDAQEILDRVRRPIPKDNPLEQYLTDTQNKAQFIKNIHLKLTRLYLGYLAREHTALVGESQARKNNY